MSDHKQDTSSSIDKVIEIMAAFDRLSITRLEMDVEGIELSLEKQVEFVQAPVYINQDLPAASSVPVQAETAEMKPALKSPYHTVKAPLAGTFYLQPSPESPQFVNIGSHVEAGDTLCILEAMKLMNEVQAEVSGTIKRIYPDDGELVGFDDPLFDIEPDNNNV